MKLARRAGSAWQALHDQEIAPRTGDDMLCLSSQLDERLKSAGRTWLVELASSCKRGFNTANHGDDDHNCNKKRMSQIINHNQNYSYKVTDLMNNTKLWGGFCVYVEK